MIGNNSLRTVVCIAPCAPQPSGAGPLLGPALGALRARGFFVERTPPRSLSTRALAPAFMARMTSAGAPDILHGAFCQGSSSPQVC
jgi:hypothetical protein